MGNQFEVVFDDAPLSMYIVEAITVPTDSMEVERDAVRNRIKVLSYTASDTISMVFPESIAMEGHYFYKDWLAKFYNKKEKVFVSGKEGKKKNASILLYGTTALGTVPLHKVNLIGLVPKNITGLDLDWSNPDPNKRTLEMAFEEIDIDTIVPRSDLKTAWNKVSGTDSVVGAVG